MKLLAVLVLLLVALPAFAGWGVPLISWHDPGDGPGPPHPNDPGDGPIVVYDEPSPVPDWGAYWMHIQALISAALELSPQAQ